MQRGLPTTRGDIDGAVINADWVKTGDYQVNVGGQLYPISVSLRPIYDPTNERIRPSVR